MTKRDVYPLPCGDDLIEGIGQLKVKYLMTMDIKAGYHNFRVAANSEEKTAFVYLGGLYQYRFMPLGVMNAPAVFQCYMDQLFRDFDRKQVVVYIDDVLVKSETYEEQVDIVEKVIARLHDAGLLISVEKSCFLRDKVTYLGHEISAEGIRPGLKKKKAIEEFPVPKNEKGVQSFHGLCSYFQKFIPNFSVKAAPMAKLLREGVKFEWGEAQQKSFESLRKELVENVTLAYLDQKKPFIIATDVSKQGLGVCLMQYDEAAKKNRPVAYASRTLKPAETRYTVTEQEALAVLYSLKYFKTLLLG